MKQFGPGYKQAPQDYCVIQKKYMEVRERYACRDKVNE